MSTAAERRLRMLISYDGRAFCGWQSQAGGGAVQDALEKAFAQLCDGARIIVQGAGRTDAGVHALAQCAHADVPRARLPLANWAPALNAHLPREVRVLRVSATRSTFHARFSARGKVYVYRVWNHAIHPPLELGRSWHVITPLDFALIQTAAQAFAGRHDFYAFSANRRRAERGTVRNLATVTVRRAGSLLTLEFCGDGFLYKMVRLLTGMLVRCGQGRADAAQIRDLLAAPAGRRISFAAPAEGLYLRRVIY